MKIQSDSTSIQVKSCREPAMRSINGRTWDVMKTVVLDGNKTEMYCDTTWGKRFYFEHSGKWYSGDLLDLDDLKINDNAKLVRG